MHYPVTTLQDYLALSNMLCELKHPAHLHHAESLEIRAELARSVDRFFRENLLPEINQQPTPAALKAYREGLIKRAELFSLGSTLPHPLEKAIENADSSLFNRHTIAC